MSNAVFPALIGLAYPIPRRPVFSTRVQQSVSGREVRIADYPYPIWEWTLPFDYLPSADWAMLLSFVCAREGARGSFLYDDPTDDSVTGQPLGTGDGSTFAWQLVRTLGGFVEPILAPNIVSAVYLNGVSQPSTTYSVVAGTGLLTLSAPPGPGVAISADFAYYFRCRFLDDSPSFDQFMHRLWRAKEIKFRSLVDLPIPPTLYPPPTIVTPPVPPAPGQKVYFEITLSAVSGPQFQGIGQVQFGFCTGDFPLDAPSNTFLQDGQTMTGMPLGQDPGGESVGVASCVNLVLPAAFVAAAEIAQSMQEMGTGWSAGKTLAFAVDIGAAKCRIWYTDASPGFSGASSFSLAFAGGKTFYPAVSMCYFGGANSFALNAGAQPFVGAVPAGYAALDSSGTANWAAYGSEIQLSNNNVAASANIPGDQYGFGAVRANIGLKL